MIRGHPLSHEAIPHAAEFFLGVYVQIIMEDIDDRQAPRSVLSCSMVVGFYFEIVVKDERGVWGESRSFPIRTPL